MIKCKNECPENKHDGCCQKCPYLMDCENRCDVTPDECEDVIYEGSNLEIFNDKTATVIKRISDIVSKKKQIEEIEKEMKGQLQKVMEEYGVKSLDNERIKVTYVEPTVRNSIDSTKLKKKYPNIAAECNKTSDVKAFVKVELK